MNEFAFQQPFYTSMREGLLAHSPNEAAAVLLAGYDRTNGHVRLMVREQQIVPPVSCLTQSTSEVTVDPEYLAIWLKRARNAGLSLIMAHSHPFSDGNVWFSPIDDRAESVLMPAIFGRAPGQPHGSLVLGRSGFDARIWPEPDSNRVSVDRIGEVGKTLLRVPRLASFDHRDDEKYDRSVRALGKGGQQLLRELTVAVVGVGGVGSLVTQQLAHLGVGRLILLDNDVVERTNLNRVVGANESRVGTPKVEVASDLVRQISTDVSVEPCVGDVRLSRYAREVMKADVVVCCTDSHGSRAVLNQLAYQYYRPIIDIGVSIDARGGSVRSVTGRVQLLSPGMPCLVCHNLLDPEEVRRDLMSDDERRRDPYISGVREPQPAVISLNGTIASLGVTMLLSVATGFPSPARHQLYLAHRGSVRTIESTPEMDCVVCSLNGALGRGDSWPMPWRLG